MPQLAVFPKAYMDELCVTGTLLLREWVELAASLPIEGLEFYGGFLDLQDPSAWGDVRRMVEGEGLQVPMLCCSPDFCHRDPAFRRQQIDRQRHWIDMTVALGGQYCRVLSGQRRPGISRAEGLDIVVASISECLEHAADRGVTLIIENHYKDNYWTYPEFAQHLDVFLELIGQIEDPHFGINFDPSNALLVGDDPLEWLCHVRHRVVTMHASDRYLVSGTLDDLRREETVAGYAGRLAHGEIGCGLNDYDAIFGQLREAGFDGWISIEDGVDGMDELARSVAYVRRKMNAAWG